MAGWQAGLMVLVQSVLQHMHVLLHANTAANNLQQVIDVVRSPLLAGRVYVWLVNRAAMLVQSVLQHMHVVFKAYI